MYRFPVTALRGLSSTIFTFKNGAGFSVVELLVVISLMGIITGAYLWNAGSFRQGVAITRAGQAMAFALRDAESRAMSVHADSYVNPQTFPSGYGIFFENSQPQRYILFFDGGASPNGLYDSPTEHITTYTLPNYLRIKELQIDPAGSPSPISNSLTVVYRRPLPTTEVRVNGTLSPATNFGIVLESENGNYKKTIQAWITGQIAVQ